VFSPRRIEEDSPECQATTFLVAAKAAAKTASVEDGLCSSRAGLLGSGVGGDVVKRSSSM